MHKPDSQGTRSQLANLDLYRSQPDVKKNWDLSNLSDQDEMRLGEDLHNMILQFNPPARNGLLVERVHEAANRCWQESTRKDIRYTFTILDSSDINSFSHPGGHVYLSRGIVLLHRRGEDAALQFVLAHEIAHVDHQDMIHCLLDPGVQRST